MVETGKDGEGEHLLVLIQAGVENVKEFYTTNCTNVWNDRKHPGPILSVLKALSKEAPLSCSRLIQELNKSTDAMKMKKRYQKVERRMEKVVKAAVEKSCEVG